MRPYQWYVYIPMSVVLISNINHHQLFSSKNAFGGVAIMTLKFKTKGDILENYVITKYGFSG